MESIETLKSALEQIVILEQTDPLAVKSSFP
jgi:hypothetical protein